jgi:uncharacterized membrane protein YbhN (UPF0104 family)
MSSRAARRLVASVRVGVTLGVAWLIANQVDWGVILGLLARADPTRLVLAGLMLSVQFIMMVWRWQIVIELLGGQMLHSTQLAIALGRSMLLGQPLPSTLGGDVVRMVVLSRQTGLALAARSVICDRLLAVAVLIALVIVTLPLFSLFIESGRAFVAVAIVSVVGLGTFVAVLALPDWVIAVPGLGRRWATLVGDLTIVLFGGTRANLALALALATHLFGVLLVYELARALGASISLVDGLFIVPPTLLISALPISLGGWGVREGALGAGFVLVGLSSEAGVATSVLFGLTGPLIGLITEVATPMLRMREIPPKDAA